MTDFIYHLIINRNAGSGNGAQAAQAVINDLKKRQLPFETYATDYQGHAFELTNHLLATTLKPWKAEDDLDLPFPLLVVLGGDGTLHEVINALGDFPDIPVAYLPAGSGNDFARGVAIPLLPLKALEQLLAIKEPQLVNLISYHELIQDEKGLATNNIGIGVDAAIVAKSNSSKAKATLNKFKLGSLTYLFSAISVLFKQSGFPVLIEANGQEHPFKKTFLCTTTNHPYFGGGVAIAPTADIKRPELELILVERINLFKIFHLITQLLQKKHLGSKHVHHFKSKQLRIISTTSQFGQADGEELGLRPFDMQFSTTSHLFWLA